jgi:iron complex transport system substrate-binding protein
LKTKLNILIVAVLSLIIVITVAGCVPNGSGTSNYEDEILSDNSFVDDMGNIITVDEPFERIISLYSAHTENLYTIGAGDLLIGVNKSSIYPSDAAFLDRYDYNDDPEEIIAANPDLVIIRPFINRKSPEFVEMLETAGITVVSLYPGSFDEFETYIQKLAILTGTQDEAEEQVALLYERLDEIAETTSAVPDDEKLTCFFEATQTNYRTVTPDSNPALAIELAGGINIAADAEPIQFGSTIASFGLEKILLNAENIDLYITQRGAMNAGGSIMAIEQREGFDAITAVKNDMILEINEKIISSPTFRYYKGVLEIARAMYPELMDDLTDYMTDEPLTRENFAAISVKFMHTPIFVPSSSHYYETDYYVHTYGMFTDIDYLDEDFDLIETSVLNSYIDSKEDDDGNEYFDRNALYTKDELAKFVYIVGDYEKQDTHVEINDLDSCDNSIIIQDLVDNGVFTLDEKGNFNPDTTYTNNEMIEFLKTIEIEDDYEHVVEEADEEDYEESK